MLSSVLKEKNAVILEKYRAQVEDQRAGAVNAYNSYMKGELPLFVDADGILRRVYVRDIEKDLLLAITNGKNYAEYKVNKHYFPGFRGDNLSFLTGKYYIKELGSKEMIEIFGCPSLVTGISELLQIRGSFTETAHSCGVLRFEVPYIE